MLKRVAIVIVFYLALLTGLSCTQADSPTTEALMTNPPSTSIPTVPVTVAATTTSAPAAAEPTSTLLPTSPPPTSTTVPIVPQTVTSTPPPPPTPIEVPAPAATAVPTSTATAAVLQPDGLPIDVGLAPLGANLQWVAFFDNRTQGWFVYDPSGTFTVDALVPISPPGLTIPEDVSDLGTLTQLVPGSLYIVSVVEGQNPVLGGRILPLSPGVNFVKWTVG